ncbi:kinase-like domain-containing protein [Collybia nuda]|uniref:non-specific serine/threonine protein kinase n=1 Tax=Collybia nuda TaxID=64659 RepID=A0A9P5Y9V0_9AGAR|nr:kinase-like domain-containing protein [Collybia nuda]
MLSIQNTSALVHSFSTMSKNYNHVPPILDTSAGSVYSDPDESFESLIPNDPRLSDFIVLKLLGTGGHSKVFLVKEKLTSRLQALKVISKDGHQDQFIIILSEQRIQAKLSMDDHECFLPLISSWHDENNFYLVSEYLGGGDMAFEMIRSRTFDEDRARFYIAEIVIALEILHSQKIIHRDVKPANIMFRADGHIVLGDFGYSKLFDAPTGRSSSPLDSKNPPEYVSFDVTADSDSGSFLTEESYSTSEFCGTPYYMSPEQHAGEEYSFEIDLWAVGVILYRMLTARMPFGGDANNKAEIGTSVITDELQFSKNDHVSPAAQDLLNGLLAKDPSNRLAPQDIKSHSFFKGFPWEKAERRQLKAPWIPYISPPPKNPSTALTIIQGTPYDVMTDPLPQFRFTCSKLYQRRRQPVEDKKRSREALKKTSKFFGGLFKKSPKSQVFLPPKVLRPPLRPLVLPGMVKEHSRFHSPISSIKAKNFRDSGLLSESSYYAYSKYIKNPLSKVAPPSRVVVISPSTLGCGNPGVVDIVYPDTTMVFTDSPVVDISSPADSCSPVVYSFPSAPPPAATSPLPTDSPSTVVTCARPGSTDPISTAPSNNQPGPGLASAHPGLSARLSTSRTSLPSSRPPIPLSRCPTSGLSSPKVASSRKKIREGPPGLPTRFKPPVSAPSSAKHISRSHRTRKSPSGGSRTTSNSSSHKRLGPEVHPNVLLYGVGKPVPPSNHPSKKWSRSQRGQAITAKSGRSRSASPPLGSNGMNRQRPTLSPSTAGVLGYALEQPFVVRFDSIPDNFRIGRRHPAFLSPAPGTPDFLESRRSNNTTARRGRPSVSPGTPSYPKKPVKNCVDNRRNFSAPVPRVPTHSREVHNIPLARTYPNTCALSTPSISQIGESPSLVPASPPFTTIPQCSSTTRDPLNGVCSAPISLPPNTYKNQIKSISDSSSSNGSSSEASLTLFGRIKLWIQRLFSQDRPEPAVQQTQKF